MVATAMLLSLALLGVVQSIPWPAPLARLASPEHFRLATQAAGVVDADSTIEVERVFLSLAPEKSRSVALSVFCTAAVFLAALSAGRRRRRWLALSVVAAGLLQLLLGARAFASGSVPRLRGTFVNPDHLAVLLELSLSVCFVWAIWAMRRQRGDLAAAPLETRLALVSAPVLAWLFLFVGLAFTGSRAGLAAALAGASVQAAMVSRAVASTSRRGRQSQRTRLSWLPIPMLVVALTLVGVIGFQAGFGRFLATSRYEVIAAERFRVWDASLDLVGPFAFLGSGIGSFRETFEQVQPADLTLTWTRAHNDYLELLLTTGYLGLALAAVGLVALMRGLWRGLAVGSRTEDRLASLAGWGVVVSLGLHEGFDFGATLPATSFIAAVVLGAALSPPEGEGPKAVRDARLRQHSGEDRPGRELPVHRRECAARERRPRVPQGGRD